MGLRTGREAEVIRCSRLGPMQIRIGSIDLIMRRSDAACVSISSGQ
jgi:Fe2+ transport system protein FeoA